VRREIEATREELARDVSRLADRANPARLTRGPAERVRDGVRYLLGASGEAASTAASTVAGAASTAASTVAGAAAEVGSGAQAVPGKVASAAKGSPVAVGLIAFGGGLLAAALIPESAVERRAAQEGSERLDPLVEPVREAGRVFADDVRSSVGTAAGELRSTAADAAAHTLHGAADQGRVVADQARRSFDQVRES